ncbi:MAG TPA: heme-binding protein [Steroidobacteraceae bacterium]|nr:heme-binding protein [Steroidobacteraceae bacterium]
MLTRKTLSLADAKQIAAAASAKAQAEGWNVVIAIHDNGGNLIYLERADGTQLGSIVVAQEKSRTALRFRRPTKVLEDTVLSGRVHMMSLPGITSVEGGLPLVVDGEVVGSIGVSGVQSSQDGQVAAAGAAVLAAL